MHNYAIISPLNVSNLKIIRFSFVSSMINRSPLRFLSFIFTLRHFREDVEAQAECFVSMQMAWLDWLIEEIRSERLTTINWFTLARVCVCSLGDARTEQASTRLRLPKSINTKQQTKRWPKRCEEKNIFNNGLVNGNILPVTQANTTFCLNRRSLSITEYSDSFVFVFLAALIYHFRFEFSFFVS